MAVPRGVGTHQDGDPKLGYNAESFYTCWIALMKIDRTVGGLAVSPKSHKRGLLQSEGAVASSAKDTDQRQYGLDSSQLDWVTANYPPDSAPGEIYHGGQHFHEVDESARPDLVPILERTLIFLKGMEQSGRFVPRVLRSRYGTLLKREMTLSGLAVRITL
jgi:hypothetical protein